jgi:hypothetical protein
MKFDLAVIGNDESAIELALAAATTQQKTVAILPESRHSSWMMSLAFRRLASTLLADRSRSRRFLYERSGTPGLIRRLLRAALVAESSDHARLLQHAGAHVLVGEPRFRTPEELTVSTGVNCSRLTLTAKNTVVATGVRYSSPQRSLGLIQLESPESLLEGTRLPRQLRFVGGDDFATGLASVFSLFGVRTTVCIDDTLETMLADLAEATGVRICSRSCLERDDVPIAPEPQMSFERTIDCRRQIGFTEHLNLPGIGIEPDENGQLWCSSSFETWCDGVFGIGEVVGFGSSSHLTPSQQAARVLYRIRHQMQPPRFLGSHLRIAAF